MSYKIEALPPFAKEVKYLAKRYKSLKEDILRLRDELLENPLSGTDLGGGLRKVRMSIRSKSQGKRGGARVITFTVLVSVDEGTIYLVTMYDKSEIESMSVKEIRKLLDKCFSKDKKETLDKGLSKTKESVFSKITKAIAGKSKVDDDVLDNLEEVLITSDVGVDTTLKIIDRIEKRVARDKYVTTQELTTLLRDEIASLLTENNTEDAEGFALPEGKKPYVIMVVGVNGVGKTTTIGKLAYQFKKAGKKVYLGAADTFRAAAVEQLVIWSERVGVPIVKQNMGSDPASVAFDTLSSAKANDADVVIIDTAGRLHNKINLMNELTKIKNVMKKVIPDAPHEILLVLDGSTGQNAFEQAKQFTAATEVNALAVTKLDGTAKGGVVIGISDHFRIPVKYIGLGEGMEDLQVFRKREFVNSLFGE